MVAVFSLAAFHEKFANGRTLVLADGRSFYIGAVGGPNDGADK